MTRRLMRKICGPWLMVHALMRPNERFKSRRIAIPALQPPDLVFIRAAHAAIFARQDNSERQIL